MNNARILVVDDDEQSRALVRVALESESFSVLEASDGAQALELISTESPDLVVLDVNLPSMGGFDVLAQIRLARAVPVIMVTGRDAETDRVLGLELGADDYVIKPFSPRELTSRVRAILRRSSPASNAESLDFVGLHIDLTSREVKVEGRRVGLTTREFELLAFLASSPRRVYSRAQLLERVWSSALEWQDPATVTEHVRRIRLKIEPDDDSPHRIRTVRGVGYAFDP
ncbi:MAG TPA: response regulator transcription factor [Acidimicrobiia bacterium]|nr:response regulator transcription factor [Acidimicrobiia bacterium]